MGKKSKFYIDTNESNHKKLFIFILRKITEETNKQSDKKQIVNAEKMINDLNQNRITVYLFFINLFIFQSQRFSRIKRTC